MSKSLLDGRITVHAGDCLDVIRTLAGNSIDSVVTDPPYALVSIVKRFGSENAAPAKSNGASGVYKRASSGFMGKAWDTGGVAFSVELWAEVFRVLKPGGHVLAFGGTRTQHRLVCAIEDAGFEIRDQIQWVFGAGFPKSHDVSKGIDKSDAVEVRRARQLQFTAWMRTTGLTGARVDELTGTFMGGHYTSEASQPAVATREHFEKLRPHFGCPIPKWIEALVDERTVESENFKRREFLGRGTKGMRVESTWDTGNASGVFRANADGYDITAPATPEAIRWQGWGTALKPAHEPICMARKPLSEGTVAANVLRWGTGAINVDGCRVDGVKGWPDSKQYNPGFLAGGSKETAEYQDNSLNASKALGRWPANLLHDGSDEVVAAFPETTSGSGNKRSVDPQWGGRKSSDYFDEGDSGSAARFFYSAKADSDDRLGSKHPTVKPLDLMLWLVRLVTPRNGVCLDPFAGTGTTGEAAFREGCRAVLIEREPEYLADIERRCSLILAGPASRSHATVKAKGKVEEPGGLFA